VIPRRRPAMPINWGRLKQKLDAERASRKIRMTICIAAICQHKGHTAIVLCADYRSTRGDYIKADDTHKIWHFGKGGAILFAGDVDPGWEFCGRFSSLVFREFNAIKKPKGDEDLRIGEYLAKARELARKFKRDRANHVLGTMFGIGLDEFYSKCSTFSPQRSDDIFAVIKNTDLGAEFLVA